ncbi:MAG: NAD(P)/FAD-dependent oxidoreductase [Sphingopyxis sp.]|nr:NAD(P)/FAD-dependent oxidoreductase [Sphingopyxis sp.]
MADPVVAVVGAGPAGVRAAAALVAAGVRPVVIDEAMRAGGQIYRRQPEGFLRSYTDLYGSEAERARAVHDCFDALRDRLDYRPQTLAWTISDRRIFTSGPAGQHVLPFDALILCTGATDRIMPVRGWHWAGCYSLGGAQIALKAQACAIGRRTVFMGAGPLLYLVAAQYAKAGAHVAAVLDTSPVSASLAALPRLLAQPATLRVGMGLLRDLRRAGVPVHRGVTPMEIHGEPDHGVSGVSVRTSHGAILAIDCDAVAMGHHLRPETQLAELAGCAFAFDRMIGQWLPVRDADGRSSQPGVYLAGDGARILGAVAAEAAGELAALTTLDDRGHRVCETARQDAKRTIARARRFAEGLARAFPWPREQISRLDNATILCRCEAITVGDLRRSIAETETDEANRAKAFSRVGMGRCQGRYCGLAAAELISAAVGTPVEAVGRLRAAAPVKPIVIASGGRCER